MKDIDLNKLKEFRKELHKYPEVSGEEKETAERVISFLKQYSPDELITGIAGHGLAAVYKGQEEGPVVLFRCELDALPIKEINDIEYRSTRKGKGHLCGHDGHMSIVSGLAQLLDKKRPQKGKVILMYQPEEETGQGAAKVVKDEKFKKLNVDYAFALHNLPGYEHGTVVLKKDSFASASKGMIIELEGKSSHAGEPDKGINPALAVAEIITKFNKLYRNEELFDSFTLITIIHAIIGEVAFGTSPGEAKVMATLRSYLNDDMEVLTNEAVKIAETIAKEHKLKVEISWTEEFPATINNSEMVQLIGDSARANDVNTAWIEEPFTWSEDFAHFTEAFRGALFGLGSGKEQPKLHNPDYDFPDQITTEGIRTFYGIYNSILNP